MSEYEGIDEESYKAGWRRELKEAVDAAFESRPVGDEAQIDIYVKKRRDNPLHDYRVALRPPGS
jgi:hypothetical protein